MYNMVVDIQSGRRVLDLAWLDTLASWKAMRALIRMSTVYLVILCSTKFNCTSTQRYSYCPACYEGLCLFDGA